MLGPRISCRASACISVLTINLPQFEGTDDTDGRALYRTVSELADSLAKEDPIMITGRLRQHSWEPPNEPAVGHRDRGR
jgi:hypothetical protein